MGRPMIRGYYGKNVDEAREHILYVVGRSKLDKVFYVDGWNGFGAASVLRSIATVLPSCKTSPELCFDRIMLIDCSEWKNRRAMQREITKELKLDSSVMAIFDKQDEEDDFLGVDQGSRNEILSVAAMIYQTLSSHRFMMIFLNGSDDEVDVTTLGIPQFTKFCNNKMIWTFSRRCLTMNYYRSEVEYKLTDIFMYAYVGIRELSRSEFCGLLCQEAATIVARISCMLEIDPKMVEDCCLFDLFLYCNFHTTSKFAWFAHPSWFAHASNYWICDGIIQGDRANDISNALQREINWKHGEYLHGVVPKMFKKHLEPPFLVIKDGDVYEEGPYRWISVTSKNRKLYGFRTIPAATSSFFLAFEGFKHSSTLPNGFFEHSSKLGVLVLCSCAFNFASPPFLKCHGLRFLGLDHCTHSKTAEAENHTEWTCLHNLMVLDLRYTEWNEILSGEKVDVMTNIRELNIEGFRCWQYIAQLQGRLPNLQRLRIIKPTCPWETSEDVDNSFADKTSMEILDLSGNIDMENLPISLSKASSLQMLVLDGCDGLENVVIPGGLPASLKSFSFDGYGPASQHAPTVELPLIHFRPSTTEDEKDISTSKISLEGCTELDNLFLRGLNNLMELDLSRTAIKILDFKTMVVQVPRLKRLFLIGCKHLRAIIFLNESGSRLNPDLELVCIDTRAGIVCPRPSIDKTKSFQLQVHAIVVDARLTWSLEPLFSPYLESETLEDIYYNIHLTSSPVYDSVVQSEATNNGKFDNGDQGSLQQLITAGQYSDVLSMVGNPLMHAFPQPPASELDRHMEIAEGQYSDVLSMVGNPLMHAFPQPPATELDRHMEIAEGSCYVESALEGELGWLMGNGAESLHLHDVSIHAIIPKAKYYWWVYLRWCRVERCPELDTIFPSHSSGFSRLETFWASDLLRARWIWSKGSRNGLFHPHSDSFKNLQHLHLQSCPRLQFVLPVWVSSFPCLETLHIIHCGHLVHIFELDRRYPKKIISLGILFPKLKTVHLHNLPELKKICEVKMVAPALESIKIRGCWGLQRLPSVAARARGVKKPTVEIEKDVWDALAWDAGHRPDHFEVLNHSRYYKKKLLRVSFLR